MYLGQPADGFFVDQLSLELQSETWTKFEFAVAWVRESGVKRLDGAVRDFLQRGGHIECTLGLDLQNTSLEGLKGVLAWKMTGSVNAFVYHDESSSTTFHPKVYLFSNDLEGHLYVGSSNLTSSGLEDNVEASLLVSEELSSKAIISARQALSEWRDEDSTFVLALNDELLLRLKDEEYVRTEGELQQRRASDLRQGDPAHPSRGPIFGRSSGRRPSPGPESPTSHVDSASQDGDVARAGTGQILLMRIRPSRGGTQVQIPKPLRNSPFIQPAGALVSAHSGGVHPISSARARGGINTLKVEIPEAIGMDEPLLRLHWSNGTLIYEAFDSISPTGAQIKTELQNGLDSRPPTTFTSKSKLSSAQWWRFI